VVGATPFWINPAMRTANTVVDLFSGLGGWSDGFASEGFQVLGVEIEPKIARLYKHPCIVADVRRLDGKRFKDFDVIVGSPPCRDFCIFAKRFGKTWKKNPPNPTKGLELVNSFLGFVEEAKPKFWVMENVPGLIEYLNVKPEVTKYLGPPEKQQMRRCFWGKFPYFFIPSDYSMKVMRYRPEVGRKAETKGYNRAKIPYPVAQAFARACKEALH